MKDILSSDHAIRMGKPVLKGMRITAKHVLEKPASPAAMQALYRGLSFHWQLYSPI